MVCLTIGAGLASRRYPEVLPIFVARYAGDTLWAAMVFWLIALVRRPLRTFVVAAISLTVSFAVVTVTFSLIGPDAL